MLKVARHTPAASFLAPTQHFLAAYAEVDSCSSKVTMTWRQSWPKLMFSIRLDNIFIWQHVLGCWYWHDCHIFVCEGFGISICIRSPGLCAKSYGISLKWSWTWLGFDLGRSMTKLDLMCACFSLLLNCSCCSHLELHGCAQICAKACLGAVWTYAGAVIFCSSAETYFMGADLASVEAWLDLLLWHILGCFWCHEYARFSWIKRPFFEKLVALNEVFGWGRFTSLPFCVSLLFLVSCWESCLQNKEYLTQALIT